MEQLEAMGALVEFFKLIHRIPRVTQVFLDDGTRDRLKQQISTYLMGAELMAMGSTLLEDADAQAEPNELVKRYIGASLLGLEFVMSALLICAAYLVKNCEGEDHESFMNMQTMLPHDHVQCLVEGVVAKGPAWLGLRFLSYQRPDLTTLFGY